ncbi:MAG: hypothetical protein KAR42_11220 [candidate division Zixibacteria bacterium]|nr:hypothetical protein [candidate division Zixibacteria bacterium]
MFSQIELYLAGAVVAAFSLLGIYAKYQKGAKEDAEAESRVQKDIAETVNKRVEAHEKREEIEQDNVNKPVADIDDRLHDYYRD